MLVLSRKQNETIFIGDNVLVKVVRIAGGRVRLAIEAPDDVRISRGELVFDMNEPVHPICEQSDSVPSELITSAG